MVASLLRGVMRVWSDRTAERLAAMPSPDDAPRQHGSGPDPDRVLLIGDGPAVGPGARSRDLALSGRLAAALPPLTRRGVDIEVVADLRLTVPEAAARLATRRPERYDAVVVMLGFFAATSLMRPEAWRTALTAFLDEALRTTSERTRVVVVGVPDPRRFVGGGRFARIATRHARVLDDVSAAVCAGRPRLAFLRPSSGAPRVQRQSVYAQWAADIAAAIAPDLDAQTGSGAGTARAARDRPDPEDRRQRALESLGVLGSPPEARYDRIATAASAAFGTRFAAITFLDGELVWPKATVGTAMTAMPRASTPADEALRHARPTVFQDLAEEDGHVMRMAGSPYDGRMRFYAGFPLESPEGYRVGVLSVFDSEPHAVTLLDAYRLRDYAHLVQQELWNAPGSARPSDGAARSMRQPVPQPGG